MTLTVPHFFTLHSFPLFFFFFFLMIRRPPRSTLFPLHDALPISPHAVGDVREVILGNARTAEEVDLLLLAAVARLKDRKSTRLNSSHLVISYAVFCLKKKKKTTLGGLLQAKYTETNEHYVSRH